MTATILTVDNVNHALQHGLSYLKYHGVETQSRNGPVLKAPGPVVTATLKPAQRVLFSPLRDANPMFHLTEALWMLAGRNDVKPLAAIVPRMGDFSDDGGVTLNGAYGYRWREHFGYDQLREIVNELRRDPTTRRCVLSMWDGGSPGASGDLFKATNGSKDVPCNTHIYFDASLGALEMTVCCRSNDSVWGAHGANAVHFSVLHELVAHAAGLPMGTMYQFSNNYHLYVGRADVRRLYDHASRALHYQPVDYYTPHLKERAHAHSLISPEEHYEHFLDDCTRAFEGTELPYRSELYVTRFFRTVWAPMMHAHAAYKEGDIGEVTRMMKTLLAGNVDWHVDARRWLAQRLQKA